MVVLGVEEEDPQGSVLVGEEQTEIPVNSLGAGGSGELQNPFVVSPACFPFVFGDAEGTADLTCGCFCLVLRWSKQRHSYSHLLQLLPHYMDMVNPCSSGLGFLCPDLPLVL